MIYDAIIVGAGLSGLTAAETLIAGGKKNILVLEERSVIGGRIRTYSFDDNTILEGGPSYIGPNQPHMQALVQRFGLRLERHGIAPGAIGLNHLDPEGFWPSLPLSLLAFDASKATHQDLATARHGIRRLESVARQVALYDLEAPWNSKRDLIKQLDNQTLEDWAKEEFEHKDYTRVVKHYVKDMLRMFVRSVLSAELEDMSALYFFWYMARCGGFRAMTEGGVRTGPDSLRVTSGFQELVQQIADNLPGGVVTLNRKVVRVSQDGPHATVHLEGGATHDAHKVIVAVPPFVCSRIKFPSDCHRVELHNTMRSGRMYKGYIRYKSSWWKRFTDDVAELDKLSDEWLEGLKPQKERFEKGYSGYTNGTQFPVVWTMPATWTGASPQGDSLHERNPALLWFVVGKHYDELRAMEPEKRQLKIRSAIAELHNKSIPDLYPAHAQPEGHPWYLEHDLGVAANDAEDHEAAKDHNFGGPSGLLGKNELLGCGKYLRKPDGHIHWASTETAVRWGGYMDGAVEAGIRAAREVLGVARPTPARAYPSKVDDWWTPPKARLLTARQAAAAETALREILNGNLSVKIPVDPMAGFAMARLEVPDDVDMAGYGPMSKKGKDTGEALQARALYLQGEDGSKVVFCAVDLMSASTWITERVARAVSDILPRESVVLSGTHTHTAPGRFFGNRFYDWFAQETRLGSNTDEVLALALVESIVTCIRQAVHNAVPATFGVGRSELWGESANRSLKAFNANAESGVYGREGWNGPVAPKHLDDRERAVDPRVTAIAAFDDANQELVGAFCVFGCHATSLGVKHDSYNYDWPGVAAKHADTLHARDSEDWRIRELEPARFAIASGAGGDVSPLPSNVLESGDIGGWQNDSRRSTVGKAVGDVARKAVAEAKSKLGGALNVKAEHWNPHDQPGYYHAIGAPVFGGAEDAQFRFGHFMFPEGTRSSKTPRQSNPHYPKKMLPFSRWLAKGLKLSPRHPTHTVQIGDDTILTVPGEPTVIFAHRLAVSMDKDPQRTTVLGYAGDYCGYFTVPEEYAAQNYEGASTLYGRVTLESFVNHRRAFPNTDDVTFNPNDPLNAWLLLDTDAGAPAPDPGAPSPDASVTYAFRQLASPQSVTRRKGEAVQRANLENLRELSEGEWLVFFPAVHDADVGGWELYVDGVKQAAT